MENDTYVFGSRAKGGLFLGLDAIGLAIAAASLVVALLALLVLPHVLGLGAAVVIGIGAAGFLLVPLPNRTAADWTRAIGSWGVRSVLGASSGSVLPAVRAPAPPALADPGLKLRLTDVADGRVTWGLNRTGPGRWVAVMALHGRDFSLTSDADQQRALEDWGRVLSSLSTRGSAIRRAQIVETAIPDGGEGAAGWFAHSRQSINDAALLDYVRLLDWVGAGSTRHICLLAVEVVPKKAADVDPIVTVLSSLASLRQTLRRAQIGSTPYDSAAVSEAIERAIYPAADADMTAARLDGRRREPRVGCLGWSEHGDRLVTDGWHHACLRVTDWPRQPARGDWFQPLLAAPIPAVRTISIHIRPMNSRAAARQARHAITSADAENEQKRRLGFKESVADVSARQALEARAQELDDGHALTKISAVLTASAPSQAALSVALKEIDDAAGRSNLATEPCWGEQRAAFFASLPLCKGGRR